MSGPQSLRTSGSRKVPLKAFATVGATVPERKQTEKGSQVFLWTWDGPLCLYPQCWNLSKNVFSPVMVVMLSKWKTIANFSYHPEVEKYWHKQFLDI